MTDRKRVYLTQAQASCDDPRYSLRYIQVSNEADSIHTVPFELAVLRCETCRRFVVDDKDVEREDEHGFCVYLERYKKLDGYCDEHK
jgi:hypothetical protein